VKPPSSLVYMFLFPRAFSSSESHAEFLEDVTFLIPFFSPVSLDLDSFYFLNPRVFLEWFRGFGFSKDWIALSSAGFPPS